MITDKDREEALKLAQKIFEKAWGWSIYPKDISNIITDYMETKLDEARKEAAERVRLEKVEDTGTEGDIAYNLAIDHSISAILGDSVVKENLITDHIPDTGEKLAIAVKALKDIVDKHGLEPGSAADCCNIAANALKEIHE